MAKIRRTSDLIPGRYLAGKTATGEKLFRTLTADDLRKHVEGTKALLSKGYGVPLLLEHAPLNSKDGAPVQGWDKKAKKVRNGAGWLTDVFQNEDGSVGYELDVRDPEVAKKFDDGSIKYTSPELRPSFTTGDGTDIPFVLAHVAATHTPRNPQQATSETIAMAMQFSLDNLDKDEEEDKEDKPEETEIKVSDEDKDGKLEVEAESEDKPEEPAEDPSTISLSIHKSVYDTLVGMLKGKGMGLPDDVMPETLFPAMIAAMSGVNSEATEAPVIEETQPVQYSLEAINDTKLPKLLSRAIKVEADSIRNGIKSIKIPGLQKALEKHAGAMQFSADAEELPTLTLGQVVKAVNDSIPEAMTKLLENNAQQFSVADHPDNEFLTGGVITAERAKQIVDEQAKNVPLLRR